MTPIVSIWEAFLSQWFGQSLHSKYRFLQSFDSKYHAAGSFRSCHSLLRYFITAPWPQLAMVFAHRALQAWHPLLTEQCLHVPGLYWLQLGATFNIPPSPPWKWTIAVNFLSRVTFGDMPGSFYWSWEIGKCLNFSCTKILLFPLKWIFKYTRLISAQMEVWKCM